METIVVKDNKINRMVTEYDLTSVDVKRFDYGRQRFNTFMIGLTLLAGIIGSHLFGGATEYVSEKFNYRDRIVSQWEKNRSLYTSLGKIFSKTQENYVATFYNSHYKNPIRFIYFIHTAWLIPFLILLIWRAPMPIRFDRKHQLIYTWHRGKFYSATPEQLDSKSVQADYIESSSATGPLQISLFTKGSTKATRFRLGAYPAFYGQSNELQSWLEDYMRYIASSEAFIKGSNTWIEKCPRQAKKLPQDEIDQALAE